MPPQLSDSPAVLCGIAALRAGQGEPNGRQSSGLLASLNLRACMELFAPFATCSAQPVPVASARRVCMNILCYVAPIVLKDHIQSKLK
mmetsp:Transcript_107704/g.284013  ORF Transcript_107704/g.284013 Transcript_107704/m.284013 type:complete len:88 (+) Transcript_107704:158-421(+)